eukprot:3504628-Rhodomonas_salina.1
MHLALLWMLYLTLEHAYSHPQQRRTPGHNQDQESAHAYSGTATVNPAILLAGQNQSEQCFFVDTGCSISIIKDAVHLCNIRRIQPINVQGVAGNRSITQAGNLHFQAADNAGIYSTVIINNVLLDCNSPVNLLSGEQLQVSGFSICIDPDDTQCTMIIIIVVYLISVGTLKKGPVGNSSVSALGYGLWLESVVGIC